MLKKKIKKKPLKKTFNAVLKRVFDIAFSGFIIVFFLSWMFPLFAVIIKLQSSGPVIYKQLREGKDGVHFLCFKFRTMHLNGESDYSWTKLNDPMVFMMIDGHLLGHHLNLIHTHGPQNGSLGLFL